MNTTATTTASTPWREGSVMEAGVWKLMVIHYWVFMPVVVCVGVAVNTVGLNVLNRPALRNLRGTTYFVALLTLDVIILLISISTILTLNGCYIHSYTAALYFAHLFFTLFYMVQTFSHYVIVWVCYDRFLALWCFQRFQQTQKPQVIKLRLILTGLFSIVLHLRHLLDVEVECMRDMDVVEHASHTQGCEGGAWIIKDCLHVSDKKVVWRSVVRLVRGLLVIVLPVLLVVVFNVGIVIGMVRRRLFNTAATTRTRDQAYSCIYITLAISFTAVATAMPTVIHALLFAANIKNCHGPYNEEVLRGIACLLLLGEHLTHFLILAINQTFRVEMRILLNDNKTCLSNILSRLVQSVCSCFLQWPCTFHPHSSSQSPSGVHTGEVISDTPASIAKSLHNPQMPIIMVQKPKEDPNDNTSGKKETAAPKYPSLDFLTDKVLGTQEEGQDGRKNYMTEADLSSARTSMMTMDEEEQK